MKAHTIEGKQKTSPVRDKVHALLEDLCSGMYEREEVIKLALLSAVAGESIFLLGPPGVGKSLIARRLKHAFSDGRSFEYLMSKFSTPDEIFGPVSIKKLKEEDKYERLTNKYLPGAHIVFLDEIWKSGPAIQNALLTILNEKIYRNGEQEMQVDIKGIITASNELPPTRESFQPLWDRMLIRYQIGGIRNQQNFLKMITDTQDLLEDQIREEVKISTKELASWNEEIQAIHVPAEVLNTIQIIREKLTQVGQSENSEQDPISVYDRRWKKLVRLLRTAAFLNGRQEVDLMDCFLSVHCLWSHPNQLERIKEVVSETVRKHGYSIAMNLNSLRKEIHSLKEEVEEETRIKKIIAEDKLQPIQEEYYQILSDAKPFQGELLKISDFNKLGSDEVQVINIYDESLTLRHRLKAKKSSSEHVVDIIFNSQETAYSLKTSKVERKEVIFKKPHSLVEKHWDERIEKLKSYIAEHVQKVEHDQPEPIAELERNLFVPAELSAIVKANLQEVGNTLDKLALELEKIHYAYHSL
ncbi:MAG: AAA family ATPase [Bacteroidota bacterium]